MTDILWVAGRYQLGNDPGLFQDAAYVGQTLALPFKKTWLDPNATAVKLIIYTTDVETWGSWSGHAVFINSTEVGRLKDPTDTMGPLERFELSIPVWTLNSALGGKDEFTLRVELEVQAAQPGLSDDFVLTRIASDETIAAKLGWK
ncbi:MAG: hypothetical protein JOZ90_10995 [Alphaproteobacteria bacterium]|nr:hypothetical protein [Alphaproteobacteria bacterium]MBV9371015.1 hypothetical protein [Alphaproteobacteria bacterium]MBV9901612.1 hypothetical protein [Alphaproteobacteria bacterium]